jgi:hypothetical protein
VTTPNYPQQPGPYGPPPGGQPHQPYGQQPPPYGPPQPGYPADPYAQPGAYGTAPGQLPPGMPPPPGPPMPYAQPPKKSGAGKVIGSILAFVLVAGGIFLVRTLINTTGEPSAKPGDCASVTGTTINPNYKKVDCGASEANYIIAKAMKDTKQACPSDDYAEYEQSGGRRESLKLCLVEKLEEGKCYEEELVKISMGGMKAVDCSKGNNEFAVQKVVKIEKVVKAATADCGEATAVSYNEPSPGITYCVSALAGN